MNLSRTKNLKKLNNNNYDLLYYIIMKFMKYIIKKFMKLIFNNIILKFV